MPNDLEVEKLSHLIQELAGRTEGGTVTWKEDVPDVAFSLHLPRSSITLSSRDSDGQSPYVITIHDPAGLVLEQFSSPDLPQYVQIMLGSLFTAVRRKASSAGASIDSVLAELRDLK